MLLGDVKPRLIEITRAPWSVAQVIPFATGTIRNILVPLRKLLNDAQRQGLISANPALKADLPPPQEFAGKELPADHTAAIRNALIALASNNPFRPGEPDLFWVWYFDVALGTGLRLGELRALQWQHINRERRLLRVEQAYSRNVLKRTKTEAGIRSVPIFASVLTALDALAARAIEHGTYAPTQLIFQTASGKPLQPSNVNRRIWQPALRQAGLAKPDGLPVYRFYDLRHTLISRLVAAGADIKLPSHRRPLQPPHHPQALQPPARPTHQRSRHPLRPGPHHPPANLTTASPLPPAVPATRNRTSIGRG